MNIRSKAELLAAQAEGAQLLQMTDGSQEKAKEIRQAIGAAMGKKLVEFFKATMGLDVKIADGGYVEVVAGDSIGAAILKIPHRIKYAEHVSDGSVKLVIDPLQDKFFEALVDNKIASIRINYLDALRQSASIDTVAQVVHNENEMSRLNKQIRAGIEADMYSGLGAGLAV